MKPANCRADREKLAHLQEMKEKQWGQGRAQHLVLEGEQLCECMSLERKCCLRAPCGGQEEVCGREQCPWSQRMTSGFNLWL